MATNSELERYVDEIFSTSWSVTNSTKVPDTSDIALKNGASQIDAVFLYADLAGSSKLAQECPWSTTAKIIRAYLDCAVRQIRSHNGAIRSFDGDRVMGVFMGERANSRATLAAREIDHCVHNIINPKAKKSFRSIQDKGIVIKHCVGIDFGTVRAVRAGIRNNNDLIWIGKAAAFSARLSDLREYPHEVFISEATYKKISEDSKIVNGKNIWEKRSLDYLGAKEVVYRTETPRKP